MEVEVKKVDSQGRVALPSEWRKEVLGEGNEVIMIREGDAVVVKARGKSNLTGLFDSIETDIQPYLFKDWKTLKRTLLEEQR